MWGIWWNTYIFSYIAQILCRYIENYIKNENISLERLETIVNCLVYKYTFYGGGYNNEISFLSLGKIVKEDENDNEALDIPIPITKTDKWYNDLKFINRN